MLLRSHAPDVPLRRRARGAAAPRAGYFRKSINGLNAIIEQSCGLAPFADVVYGFAYRRHDRIKLLFWDKSGCCLLQKRLEADRFVWPRRKQVIIELSVEQLELPLDGINLDAMKRHPKRSYRRAG